MAYLSLIKEANSGVCGAYLPRAHVLKAKAIELVVCSLDGRKQVAPDAACLTDWLAGWIT